ncbi:prepilin peptidase [Bdellovibrionota bacterium FG-2]
MFNLALIPQPLITLFIIACGLTLGSFLNVVVARLPHKKSIVRPGSHCPHCQAVVRWYDNIPVLSYLLLRGRCRACKAEISIRYPVIELLTALLFVAVYVRFGFGPWLFFRDWPFVMILVAVTFIDLEHRLIPDVLSLGGLVLGLLTCWMVPSVGWVSSISGAALGFGVFYAFAWIYERLTGRSGLGGGDIKFLAMLGAFIGPEGVFHAILISSVLGSVIGLGWGVFLRFRYKRAENSPNLPNLMKLSIPYGPFLVLGGLYYYLLGDLIWFRFTTPI